MDFDDSSDYNNFMKTGSRALDTYHSGVSQKKLKEIGRKLELNKNLYKMKFCRSRGAGGQHVNTTDSRAVLYLDVEKSLYLEPEVKERMMKNYSHLISKLVL